MVGSSSPPNSHLSARKYPGYLSRFIELREHADFDYYRDAQIVKMLISVVSKPVLAKHFTRMTREAKMYLWYFLGPDSWSFSESGLSLISEDGKPCELPLLGMPNEAVLKELEDAYQVNIKLITEGSSAYSR